MAHQLVVQMTRLQPLPQELAPLRLLLELLPLLQEIHHQPLLPLTLRPLLQPHLKEAQSTT